MHVRMFSVRSFSILIILLTGLLLGASLAAAQEATPTEIPPSEPTSIPTDVPTDAPTEPPTATAVPPTVEPTIEQPTAEPTLLPTNEAGSTPEPTVEPTVTLVQLPPAFAPLSEALVTAPGQALVFSLSVSDESGVVRMLVDSTGTAGGVSLVQTDPVETTAPYVTSVTVTYLPVAGFSGLDRFSLIAVDLTGLQTSLLVDVMVKAEEMTPTPLPTATAIPTTAPGGNNQLVINFNPNASPEAIAALLASLNAVEVSRIPAIGAMKVMVPDQYALASTALAAVQSSPMALTAGVTNVEDNIRWELSFLPNDPYFVSGQMPGLNGSYGIFAPVGWDRAPARGLGVKVAVIDSGIDTTHPDLAGQILPGYDFVFDDSNPDDSDGHGTHVAGTIAARANNGIGVAGVAFNAKIIPVKVCYNVSCYTYEIAQGIVFAVDQGARVINMSLGGSAISSTIEGAVAYALSRNVTVVAAAGNTGSTAYQYPASYPGVISVGSLNPLTGIIAGTSTNNDRVTVSAPGVNICSTVPVSQGSYSCGYSGTSMAAPHVSGIAALLIGQNIATTPATIQEALVCSALDLGASGRDNFFGHGLVQADWAMNWRFNAPNCKPVPPNDLFEKATLITTAPYRGLLPINFRTVLTQPGDAAICGAVPSQNVWYAFRPTVGGYYQINTFGSTYDTRIFVGQGNAGSMRCVGSNDDYNFSSFGRVSHLVVDLQAGQTYYIMVDSFGTTNEQILQLNINPVLLPAATTLTGVTENNGAPIAYSGTWVTAGVSGSNPLPSGGTTAQTTDNNAWAVFTFRGSYFNYLRTVGPLQGRVDIFVNGTSLGTYNNGGFLLKGNQPLGPFLTAGTNLLTTVAIRRNPGFPGVIDIDRIQVVDNTSLVPTVVVSSLTDDRDLVRFKYLGGASWTPVNVAGSNANTIRRSTSINEYVTFTGVGTTLTIWRNTGPGFGTMNIEIDGRSFGSVSNNLSSAQRVPYIITGLSASNHVVRVINGDGGILDFDAAGFSSPLGLLASTLNTNENSTSVLYSGAWTSQVRAGALGSTTRRTTQDNARIQFNFTGNYYCALLVLQPGGATVNFLIDGVLFGSFNTNSGGSTTFNYPVCSGVLYDGPHTAEVRIQNGTGIFELDGVAVRRQVVLTPATGIANETHPAFYYTGTWFPDSTPSLGGFRFQGGTTRTTITNGSMVEFFINGTGIVLYTSFAPDAGDYAILVNNVPFDIIYSGVNLGSVIDLDGVVTRYRPGAYSITGMPRGINKITLIKVDGDGSGATTEFADFDAVRVIP